jgi:hypothetical protein
VPNHATAAGVNPNRGSVYANGSSGSAIGNFTVLEYPFLTGKNFAGKNIHFSCRSSAPGAALSLYPFSSKTGWNFGLRSTAGNWKVWHVGSPDGGKIDYATNTGFIINPSATDGVFASGGTLDTAAVLSIASLSRSQTGASGDWWQSLWAMGRTVLGGGSVGRPMTIEHIHNLCSVGKERIVTKVQGSSALLISMDIQLGDGTVPLYANLSSTAIEFPGQYSVAEKTGLYNSVDNLCGLRFNLAASNVVDISGALISSASKFIFQVDSASSASATFTTTGATLTGAGDVQLFNFTAPWSSMTFSRCDTVYANGAKIENCKFIEPLSCGVITGYPDRIKNTSFTSAGSGHAIELTTPGTYTLDGNTFAGYGASASTDATIYNNSGGLVVLNVINTEGSVPTVRNGSGASTTVNYPVTFTVTGILTGAEVRLLGASGSEYAGGVESASASSNTWTYSWAGATDAAEFVVILGGYKIIRQAVTLGYDNKTIDIIMQPEGAYIP